METVAKVNSLELYVVLSSERTPSLRNRLRAFLHEVTCDFCNSLLYAPYERSGCDEQEQAEDDPEGDATCGWLLRHDLLLTLALLLCCTL